MISTVADIGRIMDERDIPVMSIRRPCEKTKGKWQVAFKETEFRLDWITKQRADFIGALEACLGEKVEVLADAIPTDLTGLLK